MLARSLLDGQLDRRSRASGLDLAHSVTIERLPAVLSEQVFDLKPYDKVFAAEWMDARHALLGTKCNRLLQLDTVTGAVVNRPLPHTPVRPWVVPDTGWVPCGIHAVRINSARDMVATGGRDPNDTVVLRLSDFSLVQTLMGHMDWVFGLAWVSDRHLVSCSRDQSVTLWRVPEGDAGDPQVQMKCYSDKRDMKRSNYGKVRDIVFCPKLGRVAALTTRGAVKLMDPARDLATVRLIKLEHREEPVCLALRPDLVAAGSAAHVSLADPRQRPAAAALYAVPSPDKLMGVRSVSLQEHVLCFGTGHGRLCFWDLRAKGFLPTEPQQHVAVAQPQQHVDVAQPQQRDAVAQPQQQGGGGAEGLDGGQALPLQAMPAEPRRCRQTGAGWLLRDETYHDLFANDDIRNGVLAHAWDPTNTRLLTCGGPLTYGLKGCYAALWS